MSDNASPCCGTCRFAVRINSNHVAQNASHRECFGMPPTIIIMGATPDALGRPQLNIQTMSPRVAVDRAACSLYRQMLDS